MEREESAGRAAVLCSTTAEGGRPCVPFAALRRERPEHSREAASPEIIDAFPPAISPLQSLVRTLTEFFLKRRGRCFEGWTELKILQYVQWHLLNGSLFVACEPPRRAGILSTLRSAVVRRSPCPASVAGNVSPARGIAAEDGPAGFARVSCAGEFSLHSSLSTRHSSPVALAAIAWLGNADAIQALATYGMPQFVWQELPKNGDSILIADVAGNRRWMPEILKQVYGAWPDSPRKRVFTYRRSKLVELNWQTIFRFSGLRAAACAERASAPAVFNPRSAITHPQ